MMIIEMKRSGGRHIDEMKRKSKVWQRFNINNVTYLGILPDSFVRMPRSEVLNIAEDYDLEVTDTWSNKFNFELTNGHSIFTLNDDSYPQLVLLREDKLSTIPDYEYRSAQGMILGVIDPELSRSIEERKEQINSNEYLAETSLG
jgi:hypothetical protein